MDYSQRAAAALSSLDQLSAAWCPGLRITFGELYCGFENALLAAKMLKPTEQLARMTDRFAAKSARNSKFSKWFQPAPKKTTNTRSSKNSQTYQNVSARTARYSQSPIPYLTSIISNRNVA